jgi:hypothetical protein
MDERLHGDRRQVAIAIVGSRIDAATVSEMTLSMMTVHVNTNIKITISKLIVDTQQDDT